MRRVVNNQNFVRPRGRLQWFCVASALIVGASGWLRGDAGSGPIVSEQLAYVPEFDVIEIPVPVHPVPSGMRVSEIAIKMAKYPAHQVPEGSLRDLAVYGRARSIVPLPAGMPIIAANLSIEEERNPVATKIPSGMRAMTVKVEGSGTAGWVTPGSTVDVLLIERSKTTVIAEKVRVLPTTKDGAAHVLETGTRDSGIITLLVTPEQCLAINTASPLGKITFALRSVHDDSSWSSATFTPENLVPGGGGKRSGSVVTGVVSVSDGERTQRYALADGRWLKTEGVPEGFFNDR